MRRIFVLLAVVILYGSCYAADTPQKTVSRAEVIEKLSTSDFLKKKIGDLLNWSVGYDITKINRTNLAPTISFLQVTPVKVPPDNRTLVLLTAKVSDPKGLDNIRGVRADLSSIKKLPNTMLVDNGLWGDARSSDGVYTLQTSVPYDVTTGSKDIAVAVANKAGWVAFGGTNIEVQTNPIVSEAKAFPDKAPPDGTTGILLTAIVRNPGRQEDLREIIVDLKSIGMGGSVKMYDDGTNGDAKAGDGIFSVAVTVKPGTISGAKKLTVKALNVYGGEGSGGIDLTVE